MFWTIRAWLIKRLIGKSPAMFNMVVYGSVEPASGSKGGIIRGNTFHVKPGSYGITLTGTSNIEVTGNHMSNVNSLG